MTVTQISFGTNEDETDCCFVLDIEHGGETYEVLQKFEPEELEQMADAMKDAAKKARVLRRQRRN